ncbi:hypothetical protein ACLM5J_03825 [Nocardioides sp. Bht2]|uniref:hypothetical protein n=1 Tax=Nocardioides sp. Bht2 TaxID=3392297 RepID=UPI0039B61CFE
MKQIKKTIAIIAVTVGLAVGTQVGTPVQTAADTGWGQIVAPGDSGGSTVPVEAPKPPRGKKFNS